jgi:hypothetical protein
MNTLGYVFLWPTAVLSRAGEQRASLLQLLSAAERGWVRAEWVDGIWTYDPVEYSEQPVWPPHSLDDLAIEAFPDALKEIHTHAIGGRS